MQVSFKQLKNLLKSVDRNTLETTVIKHLLRITTDDLSNDVLYNAEDENVKYDVTDSRFNFIFMNISNTCPDLYPN